MESNFTIFNKQNVTAEEIAAVLRLKHRLVLDDLFSKAYELKLKYRGPYVYFRGLIEISNMCRKNCLYCGIRGANEKVLRYELTNNQVLEEAQFALDAGYGSVVLQGGERNHRAFTERITWLIKEIKKLRKGDTAAGKNPSSRDISLGITLSLGEQTKEVFQEWYDAGAHRYLLRIESSTRELYEKIHPQEGINKELHLYDKRLQAIMDLKSIGYRTGTGVMIGLPWQTYLDLARDLLFFKEIGVDMVGMGPYIPHGDTPLGEQYLKEELGELSNDDKLLLSLKMIAVLRHLMPHINIAATTALQVLAPNGRERALMAGANIIMPNVTDLSVKGNYNLYDGKPGVHDDAGATKNQLEKNLENMGIPIGWDSLGDWR